MEFSVDGKTVAAHVVSPWAWGEREQLVLLDAKTGEVIGARSDSLLSEGAWALDGGTLFSLPLTQDSEEARSLRASDALTGEKEWSFAVPDRCRALSSAGSLRGIPSSGDPEIARGRVLVLDGLITVGLSCTTPESKSEDPEGYSADSYKDRFFVLDAETGNELWEAEYDGSREQSGRWSEPLAVTGDGAALITRVHSAEKEKTDILVSDLRTGEQTASFEDDGPFQIAEMSATTAVAAYRVVRESRGGGKAGVLRAERIPYEEGREQQTARFPLPDSEERARDGCTSPFRFDERGVRLAVFSDAYCSSLGSLAFVPWGADAAEWTVPISEEAGVPGNDPVLYDTSTVLVVHTGTELIGVR
ncbi:PQQ-binding-like beta-propeller repeat protein [Nocardiopsis composta]|uniref:Pyrrolo-quinoline quinone repeat domain-containing protein n=1 Tax=Nocardiopsis composta TaxID=157465 RepID=A0A7W8QNX5_9ACTN|nr:hypothetical protein [Nocardiopsis composta]